MSDHATPSPARGLVLMASRIGPTGARHTMLAASAGPDAFWLWSHINDSPANAARRPYKVGPGVEEILADLGPEWQSATITCPDLDPSTAPGPVKTRELVDAAYPASVAAA